LGVILGWDEEIELRSGFGSLGLGWVGRKRDAERNKK